MDTTKDRHKYRPSLHPSEKTKKKIDEIQKKLQLKTKAMVIDLMFDKVNPDDITSIERLLNVQVFFMKPEIIEKLYNILIDYTAKIAAGEFVDRLPLMNDIMKLFGLPEIKYSPTMNGRELK